MRKLFQSLLVVIVCLGLQGILSAAVWEISPWTNDASTGIDASKNYTHVVNNSSGNSTTINGVTFTNSWGSFDNGSLNGAGFVDYDTNNNISGDSYTMSTHFQYGNSMLTLTGLTPGMAYELTLFSVAWEDGTRTVTLTESGVSYVFNQDVYGNNNGIKIVGVYIADENGKLYLSMVTNFHLYAFANCEYTGKLPVVVVPDGPEEFEGGNRVGTDTILSWEERLEGSLTNQAFDVYLDTDENKVMSLDSSAIVSSKQTEFSCSPLLDPNALYYWRVATYVDVDDTEPNQVTDIRAFRTEYVDEHWTNSSWMVDSDLDISVGKVYTHKVNFNVSESTNTLINGVYFENDNNRSGSNWFLSGAAGTASGGHHVTGDGAALVTNLFHGADAVLTLTGLIPGEAYELTMFTRGWDNSADRRVHLITSADGRTTTINQNIDGDGNGHLFKYSYISPASGELVVTFEPLTASTWHHYAFSNEIATVAYLAPSPLPGANVNNNVELSWVLYGDIVNPTYNLKVATDTDMANLIVNEAGMSAASLTPYLANDTEYYWQVEVVEDGDAVIYTSPVWDFATTPPQDAVKVIEWKFDETTGTIAEQTGPTEDADGKLMNFNDPNAPGVSHVQGLVNNGLYLNGKDEYVDVSDAQVYMPTADGQSFAISGYFVTFDDYGPLFSMRNSENGNPIIDIAIGLDGTQWLPGRICLLVRDDTGSYSYVNSGIAVNDGRWHNFVVARIGGKWTLYVDGESRATINGAATGNVDLDLMSIGTSLRWIAEGATWNNNFRDLNAVLDEYVVWDGELQAHQIAELAEILPPQGDIDFDLDTDIGDLALQVSNWLVDTRIPVQAGIILENMESYESGQESIAENWPYTPEDGFGDLVLTVIADPNLPSHGQIMKMEYDFSTGGEHAHIPVKMLNRVNLGLYDQIDITVKKLPGCEISDIILDFYDGRDKESPLEEELYGKGRVTIGISDIAENEWVTVSGTIPSNDVMNSCTDLYRIMFSIQDGGEDTGALYVDSIVLTDSSEDCVQQIGQMVPDFNGDCSVNLIDFIDIAEGWLNTN